MRAMAPRRLDGKLDDSLRSTQERVSVASWVIERANAHVRRTDALVRRLWVRLGRYHMPSRPWN